MTKVRALPCLPFLLKIYITKPHGSKLGGLEQKLQERWRLAANDSKTEIEFVEAEKHEIHGQLLTRLWVTRALHDLTSGGEDVLISEIDMVPTREIVSTCDNLFIGDVDLACAPYVTRVYQPGESPSRAPGELTFHQVANQMLAGPWFLYLNMPAHDAGRLSDDWLGAAGPYNDAANLAPHRLLEVQPNAIVSYIPTVDAYPTIHGTRHKGIGTHGFFARALDLADDEVICWPEQPSSLTAGEHRRHFQHLLLPR